jgi:hypothetical protein
VATKNRVISCPARRRVDTSFGIPFFLIILSCFSVFVFL